MLWVLPSIQGRVALPSLSSLNRGEGKAQARLTLRLELLSLLVLTRPASSQCPCSCLQATLHTHLGLPSKAQPMSHQLPWGFGPMSMAAMPLGTPRGLQSPPMHSVCHALSASCTSSCFLLALLANPDSSMFSAPSRGTALTHTTLSGSSHRAGIAERGLKSGD